MIIYLWNGILLSQVKDEVLIYMELESISQVKGANHKGSQTVEYSWVSEDLKQETL